MIANCKVSGLLIMCIMAFTNLMLAQCKGFESKIDPFDGDHRIRTLWIANSLKMKGNKMFYRLEREGDTTLFFIKTTVDRLIKISDSDEVVMINKIGGKMVFNSVGLQAAELVQNSGGEQYVLEAKFYVTDEDLTVWGPSYKQCRMYYGDNTMTFVQNQRKNQKLFHEAKDCYRAAYFELKNL